MKIRRTTSHLKKIVKSINKKSLSTEIADLTSRIKKITSFMPSLFRLTSSFLFGCPVTINRIISTTGLSIFIYFIAAFTLDPKEALIISGDALATKTVIKETNKYLKKFASVNQASDFLIVIDEPIPNFSSMLYLAHLLERLHFKKPVFSLDIWMSEKEYHADLTFREDHNLFSDKDARVLVEKILDFILVEKLPNLGVEYFCRYRPDETRKCHRAATRFQIKNDIGNDIEAAGHLAYHSMLTGDFDDALKHIQYIDAECSKKEMACAQYTVEWLRMRYYWVTADVDNFDLSRNLFIKDSEKHCFINNVRDACWLLFSLPEYDRHNEVGSNLCSLGYSIGCLSLIPHQGTNRKKDTEYLKKVSDECSSESSYYSCLGLADYYAESKKIELASELYDIVCQQDIKDGCLKLGLLEQQRGNFVDGSKAFEAGCTLESIESCFYQAQFLEFKQNPPDFFKALTLYDLACTMGHPSACKNAGFILYRNLASSGVNSSKKTLNYFKKSCVLGSGVGCEMLASFLGKNMYSKITDSDVMWAYKRGCILKNGVACDFYGMALLEVSSKNLDEATEYFQRACDYGASLGCDLTKSARSADGFNQTFDVFDQCGKVRDCSENAH